jgi:hypothetical protein
MPMVCFEMTCPTGQEDPKTRDHLRKRRTAESSNWPSNGQRALLECYQANIAADDCVSHNSRSGLD